MTRSALAAAILLSLVAPTMVFGQCVKKPTKPATTQKKANPPKDPLSDPDSFLQDFPYRKRVLTSDEQFVLKDTYSDDVTYATYARAVIFGKHGRIFVDPHIKEILTYFKWYKPNPKFSNSMLNEKERENLDIVRGAEAASRSWPMPGDMRWWRDKYVLKEMLNQDSLVQLHVMRAEIEAVHGKTFPDEPLIQKYFNERYWYKPSEHYDPKKLDAYERANMAELAKAEAKKTGQGLVPGSLLAYGEKPIKPELLARASLYDLRLLRNEIYAIRGGRFQTKWIQDHFDTEDWYAPLPKGLTPKLSSLDEKNVATILKKENELHVALSSKKLNAVSLTGMLSDDAGRLRNEIFARRGKIFKDKWLQSYFASMPWYKANPRYSDKLLTSIERSNIKTIAKFEDEARADERNMAEG